MDIATITDKGQITIPAALRHKYDIKKGDKLLFKDNKQGELSILLLHNNDDAIDNDEKWNRFALQSFTEWNDPADDVFDDL